MLRRATTVASDRLTGVFESNFQPLGNDFAWKIFIQGEKFRHADATLDMLIAFFGEVEPAKRIRLQLPVLLEWRE